MPKVKSKRGASSAAELANPPTNGALKLKPAAKYLSLSVPTLHRLIRDGKLRPCRQVRHHLFLRTELDRFLGDGMA
jgi:excisionase family DNA binding protein